ncbi:MAG: spermidine synthase, partial [Desulfobacterales bacterium]|nr:spermidine synthase [Desulfobacterales bacterium]
MGLNFEELDYRETPLGELILRRRQSVQLPGVDIYEVKLGEYFLMSSLFYESEVQLAKLGLAALEGNSVDEDSQAHGGGHLDVVVGGLGLGYTAATVLENPAVRSLVVVEYMDAVIEWHRKGLLPLGTTLAQDGRCRLTQADFFARSRETAVGFDPEAPGRKFDAILLDIDHTPTHVLNQTNTR